MLLQVSGSQSVMCVCVCVCVCGGGGQRERESVFICASMEEAAVGIREMS